jgi:hypothetical protein
LGNLYKILFYKIFQVLGKTKEEYSINFIYFNL